MFIIYFIIETPFSGKVKIGGTDDINEYFRTLQNETHGEQCLYVYKTIECNNYYEMNILEYLQNSLALRCVDGWFFMPMVEIDIWVNMLNAFIIPKHAQMPKCGR